MQSSSNPFGGWNPSNPWYNVGGTPNVPIAPVANRPQQGAGGFGLGGGGGGGFWGQPPVLSAPPQINIPQAPQQPTYMPYLPNATAPPSYQPPMLPGQFGLDNYRMQPVGPAPSGPRYPVSGSPYQPDRAFANPTIPNQYQPQPLTGSYQPPQGVAPLEYLNANPFAAPVSQQPFDWQRMYQMLQQPQPRMGPVPDNYRQPNPQAASPQQVNTGITAPKLPSPVAPTQVPQGNGPFQNAVAWNANAAQQPLAMNANRQRYGQGADLTNQFQQAQSNAGLGWAGINQGLQNLLAQFQTRGFNQMLPSLMQGLF